MKLLVLSTEFKSILENLLSLVVSLQGHSRSLCFHVKYSSFNLSFESNKLHFLGVKTENVLLEMRQLQEGIIAGKK